MIYLWWSLKDCIFLNSFLACNLFQSFTINACLCANIFLIIILLLYMKHLQQKARAYMKAFAVNFSMFCSDLLPIPHFYMKTIGILIFLFGFWFRKFLSIKNSEINQFICPSYMYFTCVWSAYILNINILDVLKS